MTWHRSHSCAKTEPSKLKRQPMRCPLITATTLPRERLDEAYAAWLDPHYLKDTKAFFDNLAQP